MRGGRIPRAGVCAGVGKRAFASLQGRARTRALSAGAEHAPLSLRRQRFHRCAGAGTYFVPVLRIM